jgi:hypothetical protein
VQCRVEVFDSANGGARHAFIQTYACTSVNWNIARRAEPPILAWR